MQRLPRSARARGSRLPESAAHGEFPPSRPQAVLPGARGDHPRALARARRLRSLAGQAGVRGALGFLRGPADRQRPARVPPRPRPGLQGHLPALQDDDWAPRPPEGRLGLPRAAGGARGRGRARHQLEGGDRGLRDRRVQRALPRIGLPLRRGLESPHGADRLLDRPRRPLRDDEQRVHRIGLVGIAAHVGRGPSLRGLQGGALLPARRDRALLARGRSRLPRRRGPGGLREAACARRGRGPAGARR